jgi:hypothetical protein
MTDYNFLPTGKLMGDSAPMPDRGTSVGMAGDSYGADLSQDAINRAGSLTASSKSDPMDECYSDDIALGAPPGDKAEDAKEGY